MPLLTARFLPGQNFIKLISVNVLLYYVDEIADLLLSRGAALPPDGLTIRCREDL